MNERVAPATKPAPSAPLPDLGLLAIDTPAEARRIATIMRHQVRQILRRRGAVLGLSGGIDSSVTAALCVDAFGPKNVLAVLMPERDSDPDSLRLGQLVADQLGIETVIEDIAPMLAAAGCYDRRDAAIREVFPNYGDGWKCKVVLPALTPERTYRLSSLVVEAPDGGQMRKRMPLDVYLAVIAATNIKQRTRKQLEYYHADRLNFAVAGTPNRLEYDQGFFVKNGDGAADVKPIAHLYKSQVYQLADHYGIAEEIRQRPPTTDTWSLAQSQEEFYFSNPYQQMDLCLFGLNNRMDARDIAGVSGLTTEQVDLIWADIRSKRRATVYLHREPLTVEAIV